MKMTDWQRSTLIDVLQLERDDDPGMVSDCIAGLMSGSIAVREAEYIIRALCSLADREGGRWGDDLAAIAAQVEYQFILNREK